MFSQSAAKQWLHAYDDVVKLEHPRLEYLSSGESKDLPSEPRGPLSHLVDVQYQLSVRVFGAHRA